MSTWTWRGICGEDQIKNCRKVLQNYSRLGGGDSRRARSKCYLWELPVADNKCLLTRQRWCHKERSLGLLWGWRAAGRTVSARHSRAFGWCQGFNSLPQYTHFPRHLRQLTDLLWLREQLWKGDIVPSQLTGWHSIFGTPTYLGKAAGWAWESRNIKIKI